MSANRQALTDTLWQVLNKMDQSTHEEAKKLLPAAQAFITAGADVKSPGQDNSKHPQTTLHMAVHLHLPELIPLLMDHQADPNILIDGDRDAKASSPKPPGITAIQLAATQHQWDAVLAFFPNGKQKPEWISMSQDTLGLVAREVLNFIVTIQKGTNDQLNKIICCLDEEESTPLHCAVRYPAAEHFIPALLEMKADVNAKNKLGFTPIWRLADRNSWKMVQTMLTYNPNPTTLGQALTLALFDLTPESRVC